MIHLLSPMCIWKRWFGNQTELPCPKGRSHVSESLLVKLHRNPHDSPFFEPSCFGNSKVNLNLGTLLPWVSGYWASNCVPNRFHTQIKWQFCIVRWKYMSTIHIDIVTFWVCFRSGSSGLYWLHLREASLFRKESFIPVGSMYEIFTYIWLIFMVNVGKYTIQWILWDIVFQSFLCLTCYFHVIYYWVGAPSQRVFLPCVFSEM